MQIHIECRGFDLTDGLRDDAGKRLAFRMNFGPEAT